MAQQAPIRRITMPQAQTGFASIKLPAARRTRTTASEPDNQADALLTQFMNAENNGSLAQRVREVVAANRSKAGPAAA
jgi:hypothetical protein